MKDKFPFASIVEELEIIKEENNKLKRDLKKAEINLKEWKEAWFHQRDIIGQLSFDASLLHSIRTSEDVVKLTQKYEEAKWLTIQSSIKEFTSKPGGHTYHSPEEGKCYTCRPKTG